MKIKIPLLRNCARSAFGKGAALSTALLLAASVQVKADTITNYDLVGDVVGNSYIGATPSNFGLGLKLYEISGYGSGQISGEFTAWDAPNNPSNTDLFFSSKNSNLVTTQIVGTALATEKQFNFSGNSGTTAFGIYASGNGSNPYIRLRNFRINSSSSEANFRGPSLVNYSNIADGGTYSSLPVVMGSNGQISGAGFTGSADGNSGVNDGGFNLRDGLITHSPQAF